MLTLTLWSSFEVAYVMLFFLCSLRQKEHNILRLVLFLKAPTVYWSDSRVLTIIPTMETATKLMEVTETTWARVLLSECSIRSHRYFW